MDLRLDVLCARHKGIWRLAGVFFLHRQGKAVAAWVGHLRHQVLQVVVGGHGALRCLGRAKALDEQCRHKGEAMVYNLSVFVADELGDTAGQKALRKFMGGGVFRGDRVKIGVQVPARLGIRVLERPDHVLRQSGAVQHAVKVLPALRGDGYLAGHEAVIQRIGGAPGHMRLEDDGGGAVAGRRTQARLAALDVEGAIDRTLVGIDLVPLELGEHLLFDGIALLDVAFRFGLDVLILEMEDIDHGIVGMVQDGIGPANQELRLDVDGQGSAAQHVAHLLDGDIVDLAGGEPRLLPHGIMLALGGTACGGLGKSMQVIGSHVLGVWSGCTLIRCARDGRGVMLFFSRHDKHVGPFAELIGQALRALFVSGLAMDLLGRVLVDLCVDGSVVDLLDDHGLQVKEHACSMGCVVRLGVDLHLALQRRLQKIHLGTGEALEHGGQLAVGKPLQRFGEKPQLAVPLKIVQHAQFVQAFVMRLQRFELPQQRLGVQRTGLAQRLERVAGVLL